MADESGELTREQKIAALKAKVEALKAARATAAPAGAGGAPAAAKPAAPAGVEVPVSSLNPGGRPGTSPVAPAVEVYGTINNSVEIQGQASENENLKKLLGGLGAYPNPIRRHAWQLDYRYYAEARRRLEAAGYAITEKDILDRRPSRWSASARGWTRVQS